MKVSVERSAADTITETGHGLSYGAGAHTASNAGRGARRAARDRGSALDAETQLVSQAVPWPDVRSDVVQPARAHPEAARLVVLGSTIMGSWENVASTLQMILGSSA